MAHRIFMRGTLRTKLRFGLTMEKFLRETYLEGSCALVQAWIELHRDELMSDWELAMAGEMPHKIDPL